jgi:hypothetical protein
VGNISTKENGMALTDEGNFCGMMKEFIPPSFKLTFKQTLAQYCFLGLMDMFRLDTLGGNANGCIRDTFNFSIKRNTGIGQDADNELGSSLGSVTRLEPSFLQDTVNVALSISVGDGRGLVDNAHTSADESGTLFTNEALNVMHGDLLGGRQKQTTNQEPRVAP